MTIVIRDCISFALLRCDWSRKLVPSLTNHTQNLKLSRPDLSCFPTFQSVWSLLLWALIGIMSVIFYFLGIDCCYWFGLPKHSRNALVTLIYDMFSFLSRFDQVKIKTMRKIIIFAFVYGKLNPAYLRTLNWQDQIYSSSVCRGFPVLCTSCMFSCALCKLHALLRLPLVECFPEFCAGCMFFCLWSKFDAFIMSYQQCSYWQILERQRQVMTTATHIVLLKESVLWTKMVS